MPENLPEPHRAALSEFYAGHISAGEFSRRVTVSGPQEPAPASEHRQTADEGPRSVAWQPSPGRALTPAPNA